MNANDYQQQAMRTECNQLASLSRMCGSLLDARDTASIPTASLKKLLAPIRFNHSIIGAIGELGELAGNLEKTVYYGQDLTPAMLLNIREEIGDALWYLAEACDSMGLKMGEVMQSNIAKLKARFPEKYTDELAVEYNRDRAKEAEALASKQDLVSKEEALVALIKYKQNKFKVENGIAACTCTILDFDVPNPTIRMDGKCPVHKITTQLVGPST